MSCLSRNLASSSPPPLQRTYLWLIYVFHFTLETSTFMSSLAPTKVCHVRNFYASPALFLPLSVPLSPSRIFYLNRIQFAGQLNFAIHL